MSVPTCDHLKEDGVFCGSPALNNQKYCFFHLNLRARRLKAARARRRGANPALNLPFPEDMHAVQISLAETMWAVADNRIDTKRAGLIAYMLQQAATNLIHTPQWEGQREAVPANRPLRALSINFEKRFGLPPNTDFDEAETYRVSEETPESANSVQDGCPVQAKLERVFSSRSTEEPLPAPETGNLKLETPVSPDRVPLPEDELQQLQMTKWEEMEFLLYKTRFDSIDPDDERELMLAWLREKRRRTKAEYLAAQRERSGEPLGPMDGPEHTDTKLPPFGFCNTLDEDNGDDEDADIEEAA